MNERNGVFACERQENVETHVQGTLHEKGKRSNEWVLLKNISITKCNNNYNYLCIFSVSGMYYLLFYSFTERKRVA